MTDDEAPDPNIALMEFVEGLQPVVEMVAGHRAKLEQAGFSPTVAEQMSAALYAELVRTMFAQHRS